MELHLPAKSRCACPRSPPGSVHRSPRAATIVLLRRVVMAAPRWVASSARHAICPAGQRTWREGKTHLRAEERMSRGALGTLSLPGKFPLVQERNTKQNCAQHKKRQDAISPLQEREVVQENLADHQTEQHQTLPAEQRRSILKAPE